MVGWLPPLRPAATYCVGWVWKRPPTEAALLIHLVLVLTTAEHFELICQAA